MIADLLKDKPKIGAFDTETNGLHHMLCKPFAYGFGYIMPDTNEIKSYTVDLERQPILAREVIRAWQKYAKTFDLYLGHNVKFDLHMMANVSEPYLTENLSDTTFYIRFANDAVGPSKGGEPLGLKPFASKFISSDAKLLNKKLEAEQSKIAKFSLI